MMTNAEILSVVTSIRLDVVDLAGELENQGMDGYFRDVPPMLAWSIRNRLRDLETSLSSPGDDLDAARLKERAELAEAQRDEAMMAHAGAVERICGYILQIDELKAERARRFATIAQDLLNHAADIAAQPEKQ